MTRLLPHPLLTASLILMWVLLNTPTIGHLLLGTVIGLFASWAMTALQPAKPRIRRWIRIPVLVWLVTIDVTRSNIAVVNVILRHVNGARRPGFVAIPLALTDRTGLAVLACIITATPGTAWVEYQSGSSTLLIHVLDLVDEQQWIGHIKRYEELLMEIFE